MLTTAGDTALAMSRNVLALDRAGERRAVHRRRGTCVCADEAGDRSSRDAITMPTASEATAIEQRRRTAWSLRLDISASYTAHGRAGRIDARQLMPESRLPVDAARSRPRPCSTRYTC